MAKSITVPDIIKSKNQRKLTMVTGYDYPTALILDKSQIDMILVGDSLAMVMLGHKDTLSIGMEEMLHHTKAVTRAAQYSLVIADMPFMSYQVNVEQAVKNAGRFIKEGRAQAIKLEGGTEVLDQVKAIVKAGIPVQGHLGLTPQSAAQFGGFKVQGRNVAAARKLIHDAILLQEAGCFSLVLEAIPFQIAEKVTQEISIPTLGIGAGSPCDGQVLVFHDLVGLFDRFVPKFVKQYAKLSNEMEKAIVQFKNEVEDGKFPDREHSFSLSPEESKKLDNY